MREHGHTHREDRTLNETIDLLHAHRSQRSFRDTPVDPAMLDAIVRAGHHAPTSHNAQHVSIVVVRDAATRARIAELACDQPHIACAPVFIGVFADFAKTEAALALHGRAQEVHRHMEGLVAVAIDVGIQVATMSIAARALGLGAVAIGGTRNALAEINALLGLPRGCTLMNGLSVGHVDQLAHQKPRLPIETYRHDERYAAPLFDEAIPAYDATLVAHWARIGRTDGYGWSDSMGHFYDHDYFPRVLAAFHGQGLFDALKSG